MLTPEGQSADKMDKIMLLSMWANTLRLEKSSSGLFDKDSVGIIFAGMGKPTFPINKRIVNEHLSYWRAIDDAIKTAGDLTEEVKAKTVIDYGDPRGDDYSRQIMAKAMSDWYQTQINPGNILFTVGGAGALRVIFETFNSLSNENYRVITPFPHYTLYKDNRHILHVVDVMSEPGYRLTARSLQFSIEQAKIKAEKDRAFPKVILLCNPNNPLGTIIEEEELIKIGMVLRQYSDIHIVLDEAYAEMAFDYRKIPSLLTVAPDLKSRIIILRSATKALSSAGERMAILMAFDKQLMGNFLNTNISIIGHAPRSSQIAYAQTMLQFTDDDHQALVNYYRPKVVYVADRLRAMGALMPDLNYKIDGTFYILGDFSDLIGLELPLDAARALGKTGILKTNEELAYYLLFKDSIMIAPSSYFGMSKTNGFMRITCSGNESELCELMNRLEARLIEARYNKKIKFINDIIQKAPQLNVFNPLMNTQIISRLYDIREMTNENSFSLKEQNDILKEIKSSVSVYLKQTREVGQVMAQLKSNRYFDLATM